MGFMVLSSCLEQKTKFNIYILECVNMGLQPKINGKTVERAY